jgi:hypothetical protein
MTTMAMPPPVFYDLRAYAEEGHRDQVGSHRCRRTDAIALKADSSTVMRADFKSE